MRCSFSEEKKLRTNSSASDRILKALSFRFDNLRSKLLRALSPWIRPLIRNRAFRIYLTASLLVLVAFFLTVFAVVAIAIGTNYSGDSTFYWGYSLSDFARRFAGETFVVGFVGRAILGLCHHR